MFHKQAQSLHVFSVSYAQFKLRSFPFCTAIVWLLNLCWTFSSVCCLLLSQAFTLSGPWVPLSPRALSEEGGLLAI